MLVCRDIVVVKDDSKNVLTQEYDRFYLEHGSNFPVIEKTKTVDKKELTVNGSVWRGTEPKATETESTDVETLLAEALAKVQELYPGTAEKPNNPYAVLLEAASYGLDLWRRNEIQGKIRPSKPIDENSALQAIAKKLVQSGKAKTMEEAVEKAKILFG